MPIVVRCRCGFVLFTVTVEGSRIVTKLPWGDLTNYGVPSVAEQIGRYGGRCPRCGRPWDPRKAVVTVRAVGG